MQINNKSIDINKLWTKQIIFINHERKGHLNNYYCSYVNLSSKSQRWCCEVVLLKESLRNMNINELNEIRKVEHNQSCMKS